LKNTEPQLLDWNPVVIDVNEFWVVFYRPPEVIQTGGTPEIFIEKKSGSVVKVQRGQ